MFDVSYKNERFPLQNQQARLYLTYRLEIEKQLLYIDVL